ncbi:MAG: FecR family protein [Hydrotalea sp.]|nr:FecR family protein [Hydrotalea sp.]
MEYKDNFWNLLARKVSGEASEQELLQLEELLQENPYLLELSDSLEAVWSSSEKPDSDYMEATYFLHRSKMEQEGFFFPTQGDHEYPEKVSKISLFSPRIKWISAIAAVLILVIGTWYFGIFNHSNVDATIANSPSSLKEVSARPASKTKLVLPDGTTVWLNSGSKLTYDSWSGKSSREVYLIGEAFFDVTKNASKPFIIHTKHLDVKVLGTSFNVRAYPEDEVTETSLIHGSVEVYLHRQPEKIFRLVPNQKLVVKNTVLDGSSKKDVEIDLNQAVSILPLKPIVLSNSDAQLVETGWLNNLLLFEDESFGEIAKKMERWYDVKIQFSNNTLAEIRMTGSFEKETLIQAIEALRFISNFNYKVENDLITIY